jgi:NitT/TauT family transport system ATP-binding protein
MTQLAPSAPRRSEEHAPALDLARVSKRYGGADGVVALQDVTLKVAPGEFVCLVGASGCGKTTLLNLIAGLDRPTTGSVSLAFSEPGSDADRTFAPTTSGDGTTTAMLFQDSALFPWLTVAANVELPLRLKGIGRAERRARAADLLERVHLGGFGPKRPHELSGGMRQRAALARALAQDAGLLLMDEPFGALDPVTRAELQREFSKLVRRLGKTIVFVTHDIREALLLASRIILLESGRIVASGEPPEFLRIDHPEVRAFASCMDDDPGASA